MPLSRRALLALLIASTASPVFAAQPPVFAIKGVAIQGYDPVAYFDLQGPQQGRAEITSRWNGAIWRFTSSQNKARFDADPTAFAPQYGGYCAYAVSKGATATTDPAAWSVVDNKLYLNYSPAVRKIWRRDIAGNISRANANWPNVLQ